MRTLLAAALAAFALSAAAQGFPSRPVRIIVPFAPGGAGDIMARLLAEQMSPPLGQQVLVENRPGRGVIFSFMREGWPSPGPDAGAWRLLLYGAIFSAPAIAAVLMFLL